VESEFDANKKEGGDKDTWIDVAKDFASRIEVTQKRHPFCQPAPHLLFTGEGS